MKIHFRTDKGIHGSEDYTAQFITQISDELSPYCHHINEIRGYLLDENIQSGRHTSSCLLEAAVEGQNTFEISGSGDTPEQAISKTLNELKRTLNVLLGRWTSH